MRSGLSESQRATSTTAHKWPGLWSGRHHLNTSPVELPFIPFTECASHFLQSIHFLSRCEVSSEQFCDTTTTFLRSGITMQAFLNLGHVDDQVGQNAGRGGGAYLSLYYVISCSCTLLMLQQSTAFLQYHSPNF